MEPEPADACAAKSTMRDQLETAEGQITSPKLQLATAQFALEKLPGETFMTEADH